MAEHNNDSINGSISVAHQTDLSRFVIMVDGEEAGYASYVDTEEYRDFNHTVVYPEFQGKGLSKPLIKEALDEAREHNKPVKPSCSAVEGFIAKNPEYKALVF